MSTKKKVNNQDSQQPKKLTLVEISKLAKQAQRYKEISLLDGQYKLTVHENFLDNNIKNFILDVQNALLILKSENVSMKEVSNYFTIYQMLLLKHFSDSGLKHLKMDKRKDVSKMLSVAEELLKIGVFQQIGSFFEKNELLKIDEALSKVENAGKQLGDLMVSATLSEKERLKDLGLEMVSE